MLLRLGNGKRLLRLFRPVLRQRVREFEIARGHLLREGCLGLPEQRLEIELARGLLRLHEFLEGNSPRFGCRLVSRLRSRFGNGLRLPGKRFLADALRLRLKGTDGQVLLLRKRCGRFFCRSALSFLFLRADAGKDLADAVRQLRGNGPAVFFLLRRGLLGPQVLRAFRSSADGCFRGRLHASDRLLRGHGRGILRNEHRRAVLLGLLLRSDVETVVIFDLLCRGEGLEFHLQLHRLDDIFALREPEDHVVALLDAALGLTVLRVAARELVGPALGIFVLFEFFEQRDLVVERRVLRAQDAVAQHVAGGISRRHRLKFGGVALRLVQIAVAKLQLRQAVEHGLACGRPPVGVLQQRKRVRVPLIRLIYLPDHAERTHAFDMLPVDLVRGGRSSLEIAVLRELVDLIQFDPVF